MVRGETGGGVGTLIALIKGGGVERSQLAVESA